MKKETKKTIKKKVTPKKEKVFDADEKMSIELIASLLLEFSNTKYWAALKQINSGWRRTIEEGLRTIDPFKEPTQMARGQGQLLALNFLEGFIKEEKEKNAKIESGKNT